MGKQKPLAPDKKSDYWWVDSRRLIEEEGFNRREKYGNIEQLAKQIRAQGVESLDPLMCYKQGEFYVVIKGHRRRRALKILEEEGEIIMVRILLERKGYSKEMRILDQITGNEGMPYSPWEQAKVLRDLRGLGWSEETLIERSGKSTVYVRRLLSLADAPQKLINLVREGPVSATLAMDAIAEDRILVEKGEQPVKVAELIERAEKNQLVVPSAPELFPDENPNPKSARVTSGDLHKPVSFKKVNKWVANINEKGLSAKKLEVLTFVCQWLEGNLSEDYFNEYFGIEES